MDFGTILGVLARFFEEKGFRYAAVGGVALAAYGFPRTTLDLDFAVELRAQEELIAFLEARGYRTLHRSGGYSNHAHADPEMGRIDLIYVKADTAEELFAGCQLLPGPRGHTMPVPRPEHLVAMKVVAMKNDPGRTFQEMTDIRFLLRLPGVDRRRVADYFERQGLRGRFDEIERTL